MRSDQDGDRSEIEEEQDQDQEQEQDIHMASDDDESEPADEPGEPRSDGEDSERGGELAKSQERYLRLAAEFENYRKRTERERGQGTIRAQASLLERLLEPLDDLQRVAHFTAENATLESLLEGVQMVERKLVRVLESAGLEVVAAKGEQFDPSRHEALMTAEAESPEEDESVGEVFQNGYQFKGVLLRPARVQVKKYQ